MIAVADMRSEAAQPQHLRGAMKKLLLQALVHRRASFDKPTKWRGRNATVGGGCRSRRAVMTADAAVGARLRQPSLKLKGCFARQATRRSERTVRFGTVETREYAAAIGDCPYTTEGPPLSLGWSYRCGGAVQIDDGQGRRFLRAAEDISLRIPPEERVSMLLRAGFSPHEIHLAASKVRDRGNERRGRLPARCRAVVEGAGRLREGLRRMIGGGGREMDFPLIGQRDILELVR